MNNIKNLWNKFNNWIDPKVGVHIFWIVPVFWTLLVLDYFKDNLYNAFKRVKNLFQKHDIKNLKKLSGIK
jgi:hypothetical protein